MTETAVVRYTRNLASPVQSPADFGTLLQANRQELSGLIPTWSGLAWAHVVATALEVASENPYILQCSADSVLRSVKQACEFGLSFAKAGGQAYLVPFKGQCTLIIGYRGLMDLARRSADVTSLQSGVVYKGDVYEPHLGSNPHVIHTPNPEASHDDKYLVAAYSIAKHRSGEQTVETMPIEELKQIRARSRSRKKDGTLVGPWVSDFSEMCRKTVERRHLKRLSWRAEDKAFMERVIAHDNATDGVEGTNGASAADRLARMQALLHGEPDIIEGTVVGEATGVSGKEAAAAQSNPEPPALSDSAEPTAAQGRVLDACIVLADKAKEHGKKDTAGTILAWAQSKAFGSEVAAAVKIELLTDEDCERVLATLKEAEAERK